MNRRDFLHIAGAAIALPVVPVTMAQASTDLYGQLLSAVVKPDGEGYNRVDYALLVKNRKALATIVQTLESNNPSMMEDDEAKAAWINLYNAATLAVIAEAYPVNSIREIDRGGGFFGSGPWKDRFLMVEGEELSLDDIEHKKLLKRFKDPMVHYALNCASRSCPNLAAQPFTADNLQSLMEDNARAYINHKRGLEIRDGGIVASKIYSWYAKDFGGAKGLKSHWMQWAEPELAASINAAKISGYDYDWSLNNV